MVAVAVLGMRLGGRDEVGGPADVAGAEPGGEESPSHHVRRRGWRSASGRIWRTRAARGPTSRTGPARTGGCRAATGSSSRAWAWPARRISICRSLRAEAAIDGRDLRLDGAFVRQQKPRLAALDDGGRDVAAVDVGSDCVAKMTLAFFLRSVFSHSRSWPAKPSSSSASQPSSMMSSVGARRAGRRCDGTDRRGRRAPRRSRSSPSVSNAWTVAAEMFGLGVEQPTIGAADAIRRSACFRSLDWSRPQRPVMVRSSTGAEASEVSAVQMCSFTSGVIATPSRIRMATIQSPPRRVRERRGCGPAAEADGASAPRSARRRDRASRRPWRARRRGSSRRNRRRRPERPAIAAELQGHQRQQHRLAGAGRADDRVWPTSPT